MVKHFLTKEVQMVQNKIFDVYLTIAKVIPTFQIGPSHVARLPLVVLDFIYKIALGNWVITSKSSIS